MNWMSHPFVGIHWSRQSRNDAPHSSLRKRRKAAWWLPWPGRRATGAGARHITGWVSRTARLRAPATQPMKGVAREGRGNSSADLAVSSGAFVNRRDVI
jgi:hypothetical protein